MRMETELRDILDIVVKSLINFCFIYLFFFFVVNFPT